MQGATNILSCFTRDVQLPLQLQQTVSRLLNALASTGVGRSYLAGQPSLVDTLVHALLNHYTLMDRITVEMLVATLQKLSLK